VVYWPAPLDLIDGFSSSPILRPIIDRRIPITVTNKPSIDNELILKVLLSEIMNSSNPKIVMPIAILISNVSENSLKFLISSCMDSYHLDRISFRLINPYANGHAF